MGALTIFEIFSNFAQYIGVIGSIDIEWPSEFGFVKQYLRYLRIDFSVPVEIQNVKLPTFDFRAQHLLLTNLLPLVLAVLLLIFFKSMFVVLQACLVVAAVAAILAGIVLVALPRTQFSSLAFVANYLLGGGAGLLALIGLYHLIVWYKAKRAKNRVAPHESLESVEPGASGESGSSSEGADEEEQEGEEAEEASPTAFLHPEDPNENEDDGDDGGLDLAKLKAFDPAARGSILVMLRNFLGGALLTFAGIIINNMIDTSAWRAAVPIWSTIDLFLKSLSFIIGWVAFAFGLAFLYLWFTSLFRRTRRFNRRVVYLLQKNAIKLVLVALGIMYIPMASSVLNVFMCTPMTAAAGTEFTTRVATTNLNALLAEYTRNSKSGVATTPCSFNANQCPIAGDLCPATEDWRLATDPSFSCLTDMWPWYAPGAAISTFTLLIGIPWLYFKLIRVSATYIAMIPAPGLKDPNLIWRFQCEKTSSSCRSLFSMFDIRWKYYKLAALLHKLIIIAVLIFGNLNSFALICAMTATHSLFALISIASRPYVRVVENMAAVACLLVNAGNAIVALLLALKVPMPSVVAPVVAALNLIIPSFTVAVCVYFEFKEKRRIKKKLAEREAQRKHARPASADSDGASSDRPASADSEGADSDAMLKKQQGSADEEEMAVTGKPKLSADDEELLDKIDQKCDAHLVQILVNSFLALGFGAFLGIAITVIGVLYSSALGTNIEPMTAYAGSSLPSGLSASTLEYAGYASWTEFTSNCCCQYKLDTDPLTGALVDNSVTSVTETWKCKPATAVAGVKFTYKTRVRRDGLLDDGLTLRPYCSTTFSATVVGLPELDASSGLIQVTTTPTDAATNYAKMFLW